MTIYDRLLLLCFSSPIPPEIGRLLIVVINLYFPDSATDKYKIFVYICMTTCIY